MENWRDGAVVGFGLSLGIPGFQLKRKMNSGRGVGRQGVSTTVGMEIGRTFLPQDFERWTGVFVT